MAMARFATTSSRQATSRPQPRGLPLRQHGHPGLIVVAFSVGDDSLAVSQGGSERRHCRRPQRRADSMLVRFVLDVDFVFVFVLVLGDRAVQETMAGFALRGPRGPVDAVLSVVFREHGHVLVEVLRRGGQGVRRRDVQVWNLRCVRMVPVCRSWVLRVRRYRNGRWHVEA